MIDWHSWQPSWAEIGHFSVLAFLAWVLLRLDKWLRSQRVHIVGRIVVCTVLWAVLYTVTDKLVRA